MSYFVLCGELYKYQEGFEPAVNRMKYLKTVQKKLHGKLACRYKPKKGLPMLPKHCHEKAFRSWQLLDTVGC